MWEFMDYQVALGEEAFEILDATGIVYLAMQERVRKTGIAMYVCEKAKAINKVLVVAPSKALPGWREHVDKLPVECIYDIVSMDSLHTVHKYTKYDLVVVDEAHNFGSTTRTVKKGKKRATGSTRTALLKALTKNKPIILISATPSAQGYYMLYNQFNLSTWSPWAKYRTFFKWYDEYGIPETVYTPAGPRIKRIQTKEAKVMADVGPFMMTYTRKALGFEHEPEDILHYLKPPKLFIEAYNTLKAKKVLELGNHTIYADSAMSLRTKLHQLEGGTCKYTVDIPGEGLVEKTVVLEKALFKIDYIKEKFGDYKGLVIMYNYIAEGELLRKHFKYATILQGTSYAEGVNLSAYDTTIVYSMDYRAVKYVQRRARMCDLNRADEIHVYYILTEGGISEDIYKTVAIDKKNFTADYYSNRYL